MANPVRTSLHRLGYYWAVWWGMFMGLTFLAAAAFSLATSEAAQQPETQSYAIYG